MWIVPCNITFKEQLTKEAKVDGLLSLARANRFLYIIVLRFQRSWVLGCERSTYDCERKITCVKSKQLWVFFNGSLSGKLLGWQQSQDSQHIWALYVIVSSCNRTAGRRGRQNSWVWQTWQGYYLRVLLGIHLTLMFFDLLQKDLFEVWRKVFSNQIVTLVTRGLPVLLRKFTNIRTDNASK